MKEINSANFEKTVASGVTLVDFYADWCGPCKMLAMSLAEAEAELGSLNVSVCKVNVDDSGDLAERFGIQVIPRVLLFKDGKFIADFSGSKRPKGIVDFVRGAV